MSVRQSVAPFRLGLFQSSESSYMDSHQLIDAQFDRAVEIVQGLPKIGPIQTGYEDKLTMYRCVTPLHSCCPV